MVGIYERMQATASRLLTKYGETVTWNRQIPGALPDPAKPWQNAVPTVDKKQVKVVFFTDTLEDRQLQHYRKRTELPEGLVNGLMVNVDFIPDLNDTITRNGTDLVVAAIDPVNPGGTILMYYVEFKL